MKALPYFIFSATVFTCVLTCICCFVWLGIIAQTSDTGTESNGLIFNEISIDEEFDQNKIAVIDISGVIFDGDLGPFSVTADTSRIIAQLELAAEDEDVKGILLHIDSPGGEVVASDDVYRKVVEISEQKPVIVYSEGTLASGAYYVAMGADYIVVNEFNLSGSIGVFAEFYNYDGLYENLGIDVQRLTNSNGSFKLSEQLFDDDESDVVTQNLIASLDVVYNRFVNVIVESRGISETQLRNDLAKGQIFDSYTAVENDLVDEIGTEEDAYTQVLELANISSAQRVRYQEQFGFFDVFTGPAVSLRNMFVNGGEMKLYYM